MKKLAVLPVITALFGSVVSHAATTIDELEERLIKVEKSQKRANYRVRSVKREINDRDQRFRVNGFMHAGVAVAGHDGDLNHGLDVQSNSSVVDSDPSFEGQTLLGVQMTMKANDKVEAVTQLVGRGGQAFEVQMEWAYLRYQLSESWTLRAGRLRSPFFALSEYLEVSYAQPWVRPPTEVYSNNIANFNGFDLAYRKRLGEVNTSSRIFYGSRRSEVIGFDLKLHNLMGFRFDMDYRNLNLFMSVSRATMNLRPRTAQDPMNLAYQLSSRLGAVGLNLPSLGGDQYITEDDAKTTFTAIGFTYDDGLWNITSEARQLTVGGVYQDDAAHYVSFARRFGKWMPYLLYSRIYTTDDDDRNSVSGKLDTWRATINAVPVNPAFTAEQKSATLAAIGKIQAGINSFTGEQRSYGLGLRWDVATNMALKFEYLQVRDIENSPNISTRIAGGSMDENLDVYSIVLSAVF